MLKPIPEKQPASGTGDEILDGLLGFMVKFRKIDQMMELARQGPKQGERGYMFPWVMNLDPYVLNGRWSWWSEAIAMGKLPDTPIPKLDFTDQSNGGKKHIEKLMDQLAAKGHVHTSLEYILDELLWGLGRPMDFGSDKTVNRIKEEPPRELFEGSRKWFIENIRLDILIQDHCDFWADLIAENKGKSAQRTGFFATPMSICEMMARMSFIDPRTPGFDWKKQAVQTMSDPCVGTGRTLLVSSNYCLQLFAQDIDLLVLKACNYNLMMFAPWGICPGKGLIKELDEENLKQPEQVTKPTFTFNNSGQGSLF